MKHDAMERIRVHVVARDDFAAVEASLAEIIADGVNGGAAISFMQPYSHDDGLRFWREKVFPDVASGRRVLFVQATNPGAYPPLIHASTLMAEAGWEAT